MSTTKIKALHTANLSKILKRICKIENISVAQEAEDFILSISNNSVRIMINYLEKFKLLSSNITLDIAISVCTNISFRDFESYTNICKVNKDLHTAIPILYKLFDKGYSVMDILDNYFLFVKITNNLSEDEKYKIIKLICKYITYFYNIHEDELELALFTNNLISIFN
jgi:DNA polymerase III gamma/tau subunit